MVSGTVKFFNGVQGFGLIAPDSGKSDVFVHVSALERAGIQKLQHGQRVEFETEADRHGQAAARQVRLI